MRFPITLSLIIFTIGAHAMPDYLCPNGIGHQIALTFDDGPHSENTNKILDALAERNILATFFHLGRQANTRMDLVQDMLNEGHHLANHGWDHIDYSDSTIEAQRADIESSTSLFSSLFKTWFFRLPYGAGFRDTPQKLVESYGYTHVYWNIDPRDWDSRLSAEESFQRIDSALAKPPSSLYPKAHVLLLHDIQNKTANNFAGWADRILADNHCFVELTRDLLEGTATPQEIETLFEKHIQDKSGNYAFQSLQTSPLEIESHLTINNTNFELPKALRQLEVLDILNSPKLIYIVAQWTIGHGKEPVVFTLSKDKKQWQFLETLSCDSAYDFVLKKAQVQYRCVKDARDSSKE